jgi:hypothetical protein
VLREVSRPRIRWEAVLGRGLAMCAHPYATCRTRSRTAVLSVALAYAAASYVVVFALLVLV